MLILIQRLLPLVGAIGITALVLFLLASLTAPESSARNDGVASSTVEIVELETEPATTTAVITEAEVTSPIPEAKVLKPAPVPSIEEEKTPKNEVARIQDPYPFPPFSFETINTDARAALVNLLCTTNGQANLLPTTASGVLIDTRGVILTNAHVAQYFLLSESKRTNLECVVRHGAPAKALWKAEVLYVPPIWIEEHAKNITEERPTGTGEHDYALLRIKSALDGTPLLPAFPALTPDTRENIAFLDDPMLTASYPAEFLSGGSAQFSLFPVSALTTVRELLTFGSGKVDIISLGGIAAAQSGSSGGATVNAWGRLVGIITTTSEGETTAERDLRAVTLFYIDRDMGIQSGSNLSSLLSGDIAQKASDFNLNKAPDLVQLLLDGIAARQL